MYSIKPIDRKAVINSAKTGHVLVAQDHNVIGGLGSIVGTIIAEECISTKFRILGLPDRFFPMAHADYLYEAFKLNTDGLIKTMFEMMER